MELEELLLACLTCFAEASSSAVRLNEATTSSADARPLLDLSKVTPVVRGGSEEQVCDSFFCFLKRRDSEDPDMPQKARRIFLCSFLEQVVRK